MYVQNSMEWKVQRYMNWYVPKNRLLLSTLREMKYVQN